MLPRHVRRAWADWLAPRRGIALGQRIEGPADEATVVDAVALGSLNGRDVLLTGSKGGLLVVWGLAGAERVAALTLDDPVTDVRIEPGGDSRGHISVRTGAQRDFVVELVEP